MFPALTYVSVIKFRLSQSPCVALLPYGVNGAYLLMKEAAGCQAICFSIKLSRAINHKHTRSVWRVDVWGEISLHWALKHTLCTITYLV